MKRIFGLFMTMVMIFTLTACGVGEEVNSTDARTTTKSGTVSTEDESAKMNTTESKNNSTSSITENHGKNSASKTSANSTARATDQPSTSTTRVISKPNTSTTTTSTMSAINTTSSSKTETTPTTSNSTIAEKLYYKVVFKINGETVSSHQLKKGEKITPPSAGANKRYVWDKQVPSTMPSSDLLFTATAIAGNTWEYNFSGILTIHGRGAMPNYSENSQPWKDYKSEITTVKFDDTITQIGEFAFFGLENLTKVDIPNNIRIIGDYSFANCDKIESIVFGKNVKYIGTQAFASSMFLTSVKFLGTKTWFVRQGNYRNKITFNSYDYGYNANLLSEYSSYSFSDQDN